LLSSNSELGGSFPQCKKVAFGPSRHLAALQQTVAFGSKADIERRFWALLRHVFSAKRFLSDAHTPPHQPVLLSATPHRTAHSRTKYDERYYRLKSPSSNPQRLKAFRQEFSLSIIGATENLRSSFKLRWSRDFQAFYQHGAKKPPCLDSALSAGKSES
jgi:hypothetical protein